MMLRKVISLIYEKIYFGDRVPLITYVSNLIKIQAFVTKVNKKVNDEFHDDFPL